MRLRFVMAALVLACASGVVEAAPLLEEGFDDISTLAGSGWLQINNSDLGGTTSWFQGNPGVFSAESGAPDSYIAANFENAPIGGAISNWLITPEIVFSSTLSNTLQFAVRGNPSGLFPDAIELYYSTTGTSVGGSPTSTGDFILIDRYEFPIDPLDWISVIVAIGPQSGPGYYAFRYVIADTTAAGDYIGIDSVVADVAGVPEPTSTALIVLGITGLALARRRR